ncbi:MAG: hypothetical protein GY715_14325, partial [Planctomycetes bacterium]|nr:hypothetical protein [Planctomycetota bacterium]
AVYERLGDGRVLACGVEREHLATVLDDGAVTLTPETLPTALGDSAEPSRLNVLTGEFVPAPVRRARRRLAILLLLIASAATFLTVVGIERRVQAVETAVAELRARESATYSEVLPALPPGATTLPPERRLAAELARLEQTRRPTAPTANRGTIAPVIGALLARWPKSVHAETSLLSITPDAITVRAEVPSMADAQALATALDAPAGWALDLPQTEAGKDHVDVTIRLRPVEEPPS